MTELLYKVKSLEHIKLAIVFVALNDLDAILTNVALNAGGIESNPIINFLYEQSSWIAWSVKIGSSAVIAFVLLLFASYYPRSIKIVFIALIIAMVAVCLWNGIALLSGFL